MILRRIFSLSILAFASFLSHAESSEVLFYSYADALQLAKTQGRMVYVLLGGEDCPWCHKQKDVLSDREIAEALSKHIVCYVDVPSEKSLSARYKVKSMPTSIVVDAEERVIRKNVGYMSKSKFLDWIR